MTPWPPSLWASSHCDFVYFFLLKTKSHTFNNVCCVGLSSLAPAAPLSCLQAPLLPPWPRSQLRSLFFSRGEGTPSRRSPMCFPTPTSLRPVLVPPGAWANSRWAWGQKHLLALGAP